jgi:molybdopterin-containing oxidoreductase family iron-sulfur binding subunit
MNKESLNITELRARLAEKKGRHFWRSLEEIVETPAFQEWLHREFPQGASEWQNAFSRRNFLKLMGASLALAGLTGCSSPKGDDNVFLPYVRQPVELTPGLPMFYASAVTLGGYAIGVMVESHEGRPTKIEGNPNHPASLGSSDVFGQASILTMYDPDRSQVVVRYGTRISTWSSFLEDFQKLLDEQLNTQGAGMRILSNTVTSPTLAAQLKEILLKFPKAKWHQYEPINRDNVYAGAELAFGEIVEPHYNFNQAEVILSLDNNFLVQGPGHIRYARDFSAKRRIWQGQATMNRLYMVETAPSATGAKADHRLPLRAGLMESLARALAQAIGVKTDANPMAEYTDWIATVAKDLQAHPGASLVIAGDEQPPIVHTLAYAMNEALGNIGKTIVFTQPIPQNSALQTPSLRQLTDEMAAGQVDLLIILEANPVYDAPADLQFQERMTQVKNRIHLALYEDETSEWCQWHIPGLHPLEMWGDSLAYDGTVSMIQPLIAPLYDGKSVYEFVATLLGQVGVSNYDLIRGYWESQYRGSNFEAFWRTVLHNGLIADTALPPKAVTLQDNLGAASPGPEQGGLELVFRPDLSVWDGRFANNGWLQELPRPLSKITWDNVAQISPTTAEQLSLTNGDLVELRLGERSLYAPIWISPGHADDSISVTLGYGRIRAGQVGNGVGFNPYVLRIADTPWFSGGLSVTKTGGYYPIVTTQHHFNMEGRHLVRTASLPEYQTNPEFAHEGEHHEPISLYPPWPYNEGNQWGMAVDLTTCIGCNACVTACQAENNIPIVGKEQVGRGREMHWMRIDLYYEGDPANPSGHFQPVMCMHCEGAPCEMVCPVAATVHDNEGLNNMVYNRCVGTRYCANNCPYKVRRFNFLQYTEQEVPVLKLLQNPNVTVRSRGVMEKCSYCVQRINTARIAAKREDRPIADGEMVTACQAACPAQAIIFGNIIDPASQVNQAKKTTLNYGLLTELNTQPRTSYLAEVKNPNPELGGEVG